MERKRDEKKGTRERVGWSSLSIYHPILTLSLSLSLSLSLFSFPVSFAPPPVHVKEKESEVRKEYEIVR